VIYALIFGTVALVGAVGAWLLSGLGPWGWVPAAVAGWVALSFGGVAMAYGGVGPGLLGKRADGMVPLWSYTAFGPFLVLGRAALRAFNRTGLSERWNEVDEGVWLGRRPGPLDRAGFEALAPAAVLDMTAEVARSRLLSGRETYLTLPVMDNAAPTPSQLDAAVDFIEAQRHHGPVYVHCALGLGRGATAVSAWLLRTRRAVSVEDAEAQLRGRRKEVGLSRAQRAALEAWWADRAG